MPPITTSDTQEQQASTSASTSILRERRFKLSRRTATLEDRMHHLETLIQAIPPAVFAAGGSMSAIPQGHAPSDSTSSITPFMYPDGMPSGVPPPSLHVFPLMNPSTHFTQNSKMEDRRHSPHNSLGSFINGPFHPPQNPDQLAEEKSRMSLSASYLYIDDEGYTRWQGETSGLPVLDLLVERHAPPGQQQSNVEKFRSDVHAATAASVEWFPNRQFRRMDMNPQTLWRLITSYIVPDLMDSLVQCYLSTSYYILPFLHVPTFLADYGNPQKWGEPGFAAFIVAICCLASRHMDDPRVRADPNDGISAGTQWFELFGRLRTLPIADRPTLYNIQANLIAAVYGVGLGKLSKASALLAEAATMCVDAGLHRSADNYDLFDAIEDEVRKRTFWCVYIWDKQLSAHFGRPSILRLRDCDVPEPAPVDDEFITREAVGTPPPGTECRLSAFIVSLRIMVVLEAVLDVPPARQSDDASSFLRRATSVLSGARRFKEMREEEALLDEIHRKIPPYWQHSPDTLNSDDTIRLTQTERLHCAEQFVRLLIYRHRFSELVAERTSGPGEEEQTDAEREALMSAHNSALQIISAHVNIAKKGLMTYYGVHVIHQLTQAGRTLVAVLLCCKTEALQHLIPPGLDALRSCIGLLRRFSGRYVCGLRSGDLMEEFCRLTNIPLETSRQDGPASATRPPWIRPVRKKAPSVARSTHSGDSPSQHSSPEAFSPSDFFVDPVKNTFASGPPSTSSGSVSGHAVNSVSNAGGSPPAFSNGVSQTQNNGTTSFMDASGGMGMDMIREDPQMYMSMSQDVMSLFDGGSMDVNHLFSPDFMHTHPAGTNGQSGRTQSQQTGHHSSERGGPSDAAAGSAPSFNSPGHGFLKMVTSP
ncbi:hypothetical protein CVT24_003660 [Panaeolus cyanescens]|uniref:Xylanolytic transcriptional activator regulatory domain-containing protein n=1 Tax=Panaeolus cyanescens TaxID=181874 RepID=A0A409W8K3_9AGAR|nr:hypothetical protein CVT24_003660 [Panaeolus cyanescens]